MENTRSPGDSPDKVTTDNTFEGPNDDNSALCDVGGLWNLENSSGEFSKYLINGKI